MNVTHIINKFTRKKILLNYFIFEQTMKHDTNSNETSAHLIEN